MEPDSIETYQDPDSNVWVAVVTYGDRRYGAEAETEEGAVELAKSVAALNPDDDEPSHDVEPSYMDVITTHMLHRIWELQALQLMLQFPDKAQQIQTVIDKQLQGEYQTPLPW